MSSLRVRGSSCRVQYGGSITSPFGCRGAATCRRDVRNLCNWVTTPGPAALTLSISERWGNGRVMSQLYPSRWHMSKWGLKPCGHRRRYRWHMGAGAGDGIISRAWRRGGGSEGGHEVQVRGGSHPRCFSPTDGTCPWCCPCRYSARGTETQSPLLPRVKPRRSFRTERIDVQVELQAWNGVRYNTARITCCNVHLVPGTRVASSELLLEEPPRSGPPGCPRRAGSDAEAERWWGRGIWARFAWTSCCR